MRINLHGSSASRHEAHVLFAGLVELALFVLAEHGGTLADYASSNATLGETMSMSCSPDHN
ncbi:MAG: hypothetical protein ABSG76_02780 [Xanthobacteraceae bacterium]|jgi:hypothetical protein